MAGWIGVVVGQDLLTGVCGVLNAAYFIEYARRALGRGRRIASWTMALVGASAAAEATFSQAVLWTHAGVLDLDPARGLWLASRLPLLVATLCVSALIARRVLS